MNRASNRKLAKQVKKIKASGPQIKKVTKDQYKDAMLKIFDTTCNLAVKKGIEPSYVFYSLVYLSTMALNKFSPEITLSVLKDLQDEIKLALVSK